MTDSDIWAVLPVKDFGRAKMRLADVLAPVERRALSQAMLGDVLAAISAVGRLAGTIVVTRDRDAMRMAAAVGARILEESRSQGPNVAVMAAARLLAAEGRGGMLSMVTDMPLATPSEIERILDAHGPAPAVTLVPSLEGSGTNAVVCSPADEFPPSYGGKSLAAHLISARERGIESGVVRLPGLALDIDWAEDLATFIGRNSPTLTARYLRESGIADRLAREAPLHMRRRAQA